MAGYIKSPLNYTGGKYKILPQLFRHFPENINTFVEPFSGGYNVGVNVTANNIVANDNMPQLIDMFNYFKETGTRDTFIEIKGIIDKYNLSKLNKDGYYKLREDYNNERLSSQLFTLVCHSFNNQIRFNSKGEFNMPFGFRNFNPSIKHNLKQFVNKIQSQNVNFISKDFRDLDYNSLTKDDYVYCDPPYLLGLATYNENNGWTEKDDKDLLDILLKLDHKGVKFGLSNVLKLKGETNSILEEWALKNEFNIILINSDYDNSSYNRKNSGDTVEVLITNHSVQDNE